MQSRIRGIIAGVGALGLLVGIWSAGAFAARPTPAAPAAPASQVQTNPRVQTAVRSDTSPPLREMPVVPPAYNMTLHTPEHARLRPRTGPASGPDGALQQIFGPLVMPTP